MDSLCCDLKTDQKANFSHTHSNANPMDEQYFKNRIMHYKKHYCSYINHQKCFFHTGLVPVYEVWDLSPVVDPD